MSSAFLDAIQASNEMKIERESNRETDSEMASIVNAGVA